MSGIIGYMVGEGLVGDPGRNIGPLIVDGMGTWSDGLVDLILCGMGGYGEVDDAVPAIYHKLRGLDVSSVRILGLQAKRIMHGLDVTTRILRG